MAISGGFIEVRPERVIILADSAERAEDIDIARAEAAKERARKQLDHPASPGEASQAEAALRRALARIEVANRVRKKEAVAKQIIDKKYELELHKTIPARIFYSG